MFAEITQKYKQRDLSIDVQCTFQDKDINFVLIFLHKTYAV